MLETQQKINKIIKKHVPGVFKKTMKFTVLREKLVGVSLFVADPSLMGGKVLLTEWMADNGVYRAAIA